MAFARDGAFLRQSLCFQLRFFSFWVRRYTAPSLAGVILAGGAGMLYLSQSSFFSVSVDIAGRSSGVFSSIVNMGGQIGGAVTASLTPWIAQHFRLDQFFWSGGRAGCSWRLMLAGCAPRATPGNHITRLAGIDKFNAAYKRVIKFSLQSRQLVVP